MSVYKFIELVGTSPKSWEEATQNALSEAGKSLRDLRIGEIKSLDVTTDGNGRITAYRSRIEVSFKYEGGG